MPGEHVQLLILNFRLQIVSILNYILQIGNKLKYKTLNYVHLTVFFEK